MPILTISIEFPEGTTISINGSPAGWPEPPLLAADQVEKYWSEYLTANGRKVFKAAARIEDHRGPGYTFEDLARNLSVTYESVKSMHRSTGRTAKRWRHEQGTGEPIKLFWVDYIDSHAGKRTTYRLSPGVASAILDLP
jgi:hypothetical protein